VISHFYNPGLDVIKSLDKFDDCGFSSSTFSDKSNVVSLLDFEIYVFKHFNFFIFWVTEVDTLELDISFFFL
jgi:hypothetical protein